MAQSQKKMEDQAQQSRHKRECTLLTKNKFSFWQLCAKLYCQSDQETKKKNELKNKRKNRTQETETLKQRNENEELEVFICFSEKSFVHAFNGSCSLQKISMKKKNIRIYTIFKLSFLYLIHKKAEHNVSRTIIICRFSVGYIRNTMRLLNTLSQTQIYNYTFCIQKRTLNKDALKTHQTHREKQRRSLIRSKLKANSQICYRL